MTNRFIAGAALLVVLSGALPETAAAFTGRRGTRVEPVNKVVFEVVPKGSGTGSDYWCGAADYARQALGAGWTDTIYIARGRGQSVTTGRRSAVQYTLNASAAGITPIPPSLSLNSLKVGDHMSVQQANSYCNIGPLRF